MSEGAVSWRPGALPQIEHSEIAPRGFEILEFSGRGPLSALSCTMIVPSNLGSELDWAEITSDLSAWGEVPDPNSIEDLKISEDFRGPIARLSPKKEWGAEFLPWGSDGLLRKRVNSYPQSCDLPCGGYSWNGADLILLRKDKGDKPNSREALSDALENENEEILYIGKAKNLNKRVSSYSNITNLTRRLQRMVTQVKNVSFTVTNSEIEALLLECNLIKRYKPKFNIILRDDKSFPYVLINKEHAYPRIQKYRGKKNIKGHYFGPFVSPSAVNYTLISLQKTFLLRNCSDSFFTNRSRPCLLYDIKRCSAPCVNKISQKSYQESIHDAKNFLSGKTKSIEKKLLKLMEQASKNQAYEEAIRLRDRINSLKQIQKYRSVYIKDLKNIDIFGIKISSGKSCIFGMFYRNGSNYGNKAFFPYHDENASPEEILESFLFQFYLDKDIPPKILVNIDSKNFENVEKIFKLKDKKIIKIINPKIGEKFKHLKLAEKNALENLKLKNSSLENHHKSLNNIKKLLNLNQLPQRIEVYDNSHIFGHQSIGVMIVINYEGFDTKCYRKFNIVNSFTETN